MCTIGTKVNIFPFTTSAEVVVDSSEECYLSYDPDNLISITTIADAIPCLRKAALSLQLQRAPADSRPTINLVGGSVAHDVFENGIQNPEHIEESMQALIDESIRNNVLTIYATGKTEADVSLFVSDILKGLPRWCRTFLRDLPTSDGSVLEELKSAGTHAERLICIPKVYSLEESISSRGFGLKGKIDAVVMMRYFQGGNRQKRSPTSLLVPLELKTGRSTNSVGHRAQTLLYTLLISDRYGKSSLILYSGPPWDALARRL